MTARELAVKAVSAFTKHKIYLSDTLSDKLDLLAPNDRALCTEIAYGTVEKLRLIDFNLDRYLKFAREKTGADVLAIMRTALYQLYFLSRVPDYSICNEAVELTKKLCGNAPSGLVNAVLRHACDEKQCLRSGVLAIDYSVSDSLALRLTADYGRDGAKSFIENFDTRRDVSIVINNLKISTQDYCNLLSENGIIARIELENLVTLTDCGKVTDLPYFAEGYFHVQDLASFLACKLLALGAGEIAADFCAAPGGKSFTAYGMAGGTAKLFSFDVSEKKAKLLREGAARLGFPIEIAVKSAKESAHELPPLDKIICDVPCSGFGVIGKKPELRYKELSEVARLPEVQSEILENVSRYLKSGGALVYSTCTFLKEENEAVVSSFLERYSDFYLDDCKNYLPARFCGDTKYLALMPSAVSDGFFMARIVKK